MRFMNMRAMFAPPRRQLSPVLLICAISIATQRVGSQGYEGPSACVGDVNDDGVTNVADILALLAQFGSACGPDTCPSGDVSDCLILGDLNADCRKTHPRAHTHHTDDWRSEVCVCVGERERERERENRTEQNRTEQK